MATVKLTDHRRNEILGRVRALFEARKTAIIAEIKANHELAERVWEKAFPKPVRDLVLALPPEWLLTAGAVVVAVSEHDRHYSCDLRKPRPIPAESRYTTAQARVEDIPEWTAWLAERDAAIQTIAAECSTLIEALEHTMDACVTMKQLCAQWPSVTEFLPDNVLTQMRRRNARSKETAPIPEVSEEAQAILAKARLLGGNNVT